MVKSSSLGDAQEIAEPLVDVESYCLRDEAGRLLPRLPSSVP